MKEEFSRTGRLVGLEGLKRLSLSKVIIFGVGGVGGFCAEALARTGVGKITLVDGDVVSRSNINRQIIALQSTVGRYKTEVMAERIADINPECEVTCVNGFLTRENIGEFGLKEYDYVADCIDTVSAKIALAEYCFKEGIPLVSAMGAGNKLTAIGFEIKDVFETQGCPLARVMRRELKKRGVTKLKVVASNELAIKPIEPDGEDFEPREDGKPNCDEANKKQDGESGEKEGTEKSEEPRGVRSGKCGDGISGNADKLGFNADQTAEKLQISEKTAETADKVAETADTNAETVESPDKTGANQTDESSGTPDNANSVRTGAGSFSPEKRVVPGSVAFVPSVAGLIVAQAIVTDLIAES